MSTKTEITYKRPDGTRGSAILEECRGWPKTRFVYWVEHRPIDGEPSKVVYAVEDLDRFTEIPPTIFRAPNGEYFRQLRWDELPYAGLRAERACYISLTKDEARAILREQKHDLPADVEGDAIALPTNAARDRHIYQRYLEGVPLKTIMTEVNATPDWDQLNSGDAVRKAMVRYCKQRGIQIPTRKPRRNRQN
jgi:hypothetical protein